MIRYYQSKFHRFKIHYYERLSKRIRYYEYLSILYKSKLPQENDLTNDDTKAISSLFKHTSKRVSQLSLVPQPRLGSVVAGHTAAGSDVSRCHAAGSVIAGHTAAGSEVSRCHAAGSAAADNTEAGDANSNHIYKSRSSHRLFVRGLSHQEGNTINKPKDLIVSYLLSFPRESIVQSNARGDSNLFLPTNGKTFPSVRHKNKYSNYLIRSNSTSWNVCQFSETLQSTAYSIWSNSKFHNVSSQNIGGGPYFKLAVSRISKFINNSPIHEIVNCIFPYGIQWQSNKSATHQEKLTESNIQWPPEKIATIWTMANSNY